MEDKDPRSKRQGFHNWTLFPQWQARAAHPRLIAVTQSETLQEHNSYIFYM